MTTVRDCPLVLSGGPLERLTDRADLQDAVQSMARTEDCRFSPDGSRLAVLGFHRNRINLFDVALSEDAGTPFRLVSLTTLNSTSLCSPHGIDFIDDDTIVVANREGALEIYRLPPKGANRDEVTLVPEIRVSRASRWHRLHSPGSVWVTDRSAGSVTMLVCNNYRHRITRHRVTRNGAWREEDNRIVLQQRLSIPDGITTCPVSGTLAISNHKTHEVFLYPSVDRLERGDEPAGILKKVDYPHGLRFTSDGRFLIVADAGQPFVHFYRPGPDGWQGEIEPVAHLRVMDDAVYLRGRHNILEGGAKGLEIDPSDRFLVVTCEFLPLGVYDLPALLRQIPGG